MRRLIIFVFLILTGSIFAQNTVNQVDAQGQKQGFWTKKDADGKLIYQANFKDDKPVGEMKRFHSNGKIKAVMNFIEGSDLLEVRLYDERGSLVAEGKYIGQKKTGDWSYFLDSKVVSTETYLDDQKNGLSKRYYKTGELLEEINWQNDKLHGIYRSYFQDGKSYLICNYSEGRRNGKFEIWFPNGILELEAFYTDDARDLDWNYFDDQGYLLYTLKFDLGNLLNPEVQDSIDQIQSKNYKTKADNIPDPEKFMQNPEEYMRLMKNREP